MKGLINSLEELDLYSQKIGFKTYFRLCISEKSLQLKWKMEVKLKAEQLTGKMLEESRQEMMATSSKAVEQQT